MLDDKSSGRKKKEREHVINKVRDRFPGQECESFRGRKAFWRHDHAVTPEIFTSWGFNKRGSSIFFKLFLNLLFEHLNCT
ncbi:hypothetical protein NC652_025457 [Populus alba x Populus x berolinensis]|nr:hypothetical protein NC651_024342 [Populus alba x Populus x berolinensis]KAJ6898957.1 hypothetical protein NC652_025457 [Populus alba x Populus x berolinensis]